MKQKLLSFLLTMALALSLVPSAFAHNPVVPGEAVTMAGDIDSFAVVETAAATLSAVSFSKPDRDDSITDTLLCILAVLERNTRS